MPANGFLNIRRSRLLFALCCLGSMVALGVKLYRVSHRRDFRNSSWSSTPHSKIKMPGYVGSETCRECHSDQYAVWANSHHALAEREVRSDLDDRAFEPSRKFHHASQESQARSSDGKYQIVTLGFGSNVAPYEVARVIGHEPLRQFLTSAPGARWQVQELAYHPGSNDWFDVYGSEDRQPGEYGHWTGRGMNWNSQCADCHNTRLVKNYELGTDSYHTEMAEVGVACEACHGPLKAHVEWRRKYPYSKNAEPSPPVVKRSQTLDTCGSCHSRRDELTGNFQPGESFFDHFSLEILDDNGRWYADGQVKDEDYEFASFLGSRMNQGGVHCRDCHRSDSGTGNALCMRCHTGMFPGFTNAPPINPAEHGHHNLADSGGQCIGCHMPTTVYMQRHARHDHGFTIPDPMLTKQLGIPNACNRCHKDKSVDWAVDNTDKWYGSKMNRHTRERAQWIAAALRQDITAKDYLIRMLTNGVESPYWRAVAASFLWRLTEDPATKQSLTMALDDKHPLVREKAVRALEGFVAKEDSEIKERVTLLLNDPVRSVRVAAAWVLRATVDLDTGAGRELRGALDFQADQPLGQYKWALLELARNHSSEALSHLQKAIKWDPFSPPFRCTTAVVLNGMGRIQEALETLQEAEKFCSTDPQIPYAQASILFRQGRRQEAKVRVETALKIDPDFEPAKDLLNKLK